MSFPSSTLTWSRRQAYLQELSPTEAHLLLLLASIGNQHGEGWQRVEELARFLRKSEKTVERTFSQLRDDHGLVIRTGHPKGRFEWRLNDARPPAAQLSLEPVTSDTQMSDAMSDRSDTQARDEVRHPDVGQKDKRTDNGRESPGTADVEVRASAPVEGLSLLPDEGGKDKLVDLALRRLADQARTILIGGVYSLSGDWPMPSLGDCVKALLEHPPPAGMTDDAYQAIVEKAAFGARSHAQAEDRAPHIAGLFARYLGGCAELRAA